MRLNCHLFFPHSMQPKVIKHLLTHQYWSYSPIARAYRSNSCRNGPSVSPFVYSRYDVVSASVLEGCCLFFLARRGRVREIASEVNPGCARLAKGIDKRVTSRPRTDEAVCVQQSMLRQQVDSIERFHRLHYCLLCDNKLAVGRNKP